MCLGLRLDSKLGLWPLALLVSADYVSADSYWQRKHFIKNNPSTMVDALERELARNGTIRWHEGTLRGLIEQMQKNLAAMELGWVETDNLLKYLDVLLSVEPEREQEDVKEEVRSSLAGILDEVGNQKDKKLNNELIEELFSKRQYSE